MVKVIEKRALLIGITGGFGCGKSSVAELIRVRGMCVLSSDDIAKEIMNTDESVKNKIIGEFGPDIYDDKGVLQRSLLAEIVFSNAQQLVKLEMIVHPLVIDYLMEEIEKLDEQGEKLIFVESALIYEAGLEDAFDYIIAVVSEENLVTERTVKYRGFTEEQVLTRLKSQLKTSKKAEIADFVIENNGTVDDLTKSVEFVLELIVGLMEE